MNLEGMYIFFLENYKLIDVFRIAFRQEFQVNSKEDSEERSKGILRRISRVPRNLVLKMFSKCF